MFNMDNILIALATYNRKNLTKICLENISKILDKNSALIIYDDGSDEYNENFLKKFSSNVLRFRVKGGIERSRARCFRDFLYIHKKFDLLYITDNDVIHDPNFLNRIRELNSISKTLDKKLPFGLFNSIFHNKAGNVLEQHKEYSLRKTCPGVSQCYDRNMVKIMVDFLNHNPIFETVYGFDYYWPAQLGVPFIQSEVSYLEHFARDRHQPGIHSGFSKKRADIMKDFEKDRALNPTNYLKEIRNQTINLIMGW